MAIISLAKERGVMAIPYNDIIIRMAAMAWPMVLDYELDLGGSDMMKKYLDEIVRKSTLKRDASSKVVESYLARYYYIQGIDKILSPLMKNVPYRFLSPWVKYTTDEEVVKISQSKTFNGLYALYPENIVLDEDWWEYIESNYSKVCDFAMKSFIEYAKKYNDGMRLVKLMTNGWSLINGK